MSYVLKCCLSSSLSTEKEQPEEVDNIIIKLCNAVMVMMSRFEWACYIVMSFYE